MLNDKHIASNKPKKYQGDFVSTLKSLLIAGGATALIFLIEALKIIKRLVAAFFVRPAIFLIRPIIRFFFYKLIVNGYKVYFSTMKKIGWTGFRNNPILFLIREKMVHITLVSLAVILVFFNLTSQAKGETWSSANRQTILSTLVSSEFENRQDDQLIEEMFSSEMVVTDLEQAYLDNLEARPITTSIPATSDDKGQQDELVFNDDNTGIIGDNPLVTEKSKQPRAGAIYYTVEAGDVISTIAQKFDLKINTILWANNLSAYSIIKPGDSLVILPANGIMYEVVKNDTLKAISNKYDISQDEISNANASILASGLQPGQKLFLPGAAKISTVARQTPAASSVSSQRNLSGLDVLRNIATKDPKVQDAQPVKGTKLNWPTVGYRITQYYSRRHFGLDIANKVGTPLYAAESGTVEVQGWGTGYGNQVLINHGNGLKTRYAHLSKFYVKKGDKVKKGEVIGAMGSTGWSTGSHLHFEVMVNNVKYNPLNYLR